MTPASTHRSSASTMASEARNAAAETTVLEVLFVPTALLMRASAGVPRASAFAMRTAKRAFAPCARTWLTMRRAKPASA